MYVMFIIGLIIICYQIYNLNKLKRIRTEANMVIARYKHKSYIGGFYLSILCNIVLYIIPIYQKKFIYAFYMSPILIIFILKYYRNAQKIELFDTGIQVFGDFVAWEKITFLELNDNEITFVTNDVDPLYYTIMKLKESKDCFNKMKACTPHIKYT